MVSSKLSEWDTIHPSTQHSEVTQSQRHLCPHCTPPPFWLTMSILTYNEMETILGLEQVGFFFARGTVLIIFES